MQFTKWMKNGSLILIEWAKAYSCSYVVFDTKWDFKSIAATAKHLMNSRFIDFSWNWYFLSEIWLMRLCFIFVMVLIWSSNWMISDLFKFSTPKCRFWHPMPGDSQSWFTLFLVVLFFTYTKYDWCWYQMVLESGNKHTVCPVFIVVFHVLLHIC